MFRLVSKTMTMFFNTVEQWENEWMDIKRKYYSILLRRKISINTKTLERFATDMLTCRGRLVRSRDEFKTEIENQCRNIRKGEEEGHDTQNQRKICKSAAIGYMLVDEALYQLDSVSNFDSVENGYHMLEEAIAVMAGRKQPVDVVPFRRRERSIGDETISNETFKSKINQVERFFEKLIKTGDIDSCIKESRIGSNNHGSEYEEHNTPTDSTIVNVNFAYDALPSERSGEDE